WRGAEDLFETTTQPRNNGGAPESRPRQRWSAETTEGVHSSLGAPPSFRLRPRRCAVVSALRRGLECPFATGCGSAATITVTAAPAAVALATAAPASVASAAVALAAVTLATVPPPPRPADPTW